MWGLLAVMLNRIKKKNQDNKFPTVIQLLSHVRKTLQGPAVSPSLLLAKLCILQFIFNSVQFIPFLPYF